MLPIACGPFIDRLAEVGPSLASVRYRTVGKMTCTGAVESTAATLEDLTAEIATARLTEQGQTRAEDRVIEAAMQDRGRAGYFAWP